MSYTYQANVSDGETVSSVSAPTTVSPSSLSLSATAPWPPPGLLGSVIAGTATVNINTLPQPNISVLASLSQIGDLGISLGYANAFAALYYYFEVEAVPGIQSPNVLIPVITVGVLTGVGGLNVANLSIADTQNGQSVFNVNQNGGFVDTLSITPGVEYLVQMSAFADVEQTTAGASVFVDPQFTIDPNFADANEFQMQFSPGIGNGPLDATPLPAALPLFATGLGAMGLLGWRRKRKAAASLAAA